MDALLIVKVILLHPVKAVELILDILLEIVTFFKAEHPFKSVAPRVVTEEGIITLVNTVQSFKLIFWTCEFAGNLLKLI